MTEITSRTNTALFGHEDAEASLKRDLANGTLAHGILISGARGIGKATLAYRLARTLLSQGAGFRIQDSGNEEFSSPNPEFRIPNPIFNRIAANSHSDLLVIEPLYDQTKEEYANEISVEQVREIGQFLSLTPGEGQWRVVIVDSADALNANAANAILKILEEPPPQAVLLLVSHNPGSLLATIRSRCRMLRLKPLSKADFTAVMHHAAPEIDENLLPLLGVLSGYAPGMAVELHWEGAVELYRRIIELVSTLPALDTSKLHAFAESVGSGAVHGNWRMATGLILYVLEQAALVASGAPAFHSEDSQAIYKLAELHPAPVWAMKWRQAMEQFSLAQARHLDYKQVMIVFFHSLASRELLAASG